MGGGERSESICYWSIVAFVWFGHKLVFHNLCRKSTVQKKLIVYICFDGFFSNDL